MKITVKDKMHNQEYHFNDVTYLHLHTHRCIDGETTLYKIHDKEGHRFSGQLDLFDEMVIDNFVEIY